jgi:hypothetical protein
MTSSRKSGNESLTQIDGRSSDMDAKNFAMDNFVDSVADLEECNCSDQLNLRVALSEQRSGLSGIFMPDHKGIEGARCATFDRSCKGTESAVASDLAKAEDFASRNFVEAPADVEGCNCPGERNLHVALSEQRSDISALFTPDHLGLDRAYCAVHGKACDEGSGHKRVARRSAGPGKRSVRSGMRESERSDVSEKIGCFPAECGFGRCEM